MDGSNLKGEWECDTSYPWFQRLEETWTRIWCQGFLILTFCEGRNRNVIPDDIVNQESHSQIEWEFDPSLPHGNLKFLGHSLRKGNVDFNNFQNNCLSRKITELIQTPKCNFSRYQIPRNLIPSNHILIPTQEHSRPGIWFRVIIFSFLLKIPIIQTQPTSYYF